MYKQNDLSREDRSTREDVLKYDVMRAGKGELISFEKDDYLPFHKEYNLELVDMMKYEITTLDAEKIKYGHVDNFLNMQGIPPRDFNNNYILTGKGYVDFMNIVIENLKKNISQLVDKINYTYNCNLSVD